MEIIIIVIGVIVIGVIMGAWLCASITDITDYGYKNTASLNLIKLIVNLSKSMFNLPITLKDKLISWDKSEEQKEIDMQRKQLKELEKYRDYQKELAEINKDRESVLKDIEGLEETIERRYGFEYDSFSPYLNSQSTKKAGEKHAKALKLISKTGTCPRCNSERIERTISGNSLEVTTTIYCNDCEFEASWEEVKADDEI